MAARRWQSQALLPLLALLLAITLPRCQGANVTLSTITLHKKFSWFTTPKIFFSCKRSNETLVMQAPVDSLDITYNMTGHEDWQPVTWLGPKECQECELYEATWMGKGHLTQWNVCADNFTAASHGSFIHLEPGYVELNLSCPDCEAVDYHTAVHAASGTGDVLFAKNVAPFFWIGIGIATVGAILIIVGALAYCHFDDDEEEEEKQKFIEMTDDSSFSVEEPEAATIHVKQDHYGEDDVDEDEKLVVDSRSDAKA